MVTGLTPGRYANRSGEYEIRPDGTIWLIGGTDLPEDTERRRVEVLPPDAAMTHAAMDSPDSGGTTPPGKRADEEARQPMQATTSEARSIGSLKVSLVGLGCNNFGWRIDAAATERVVHAALACGINFFDTADVYDQGHSEEYLARALAGRRGEAVIASKFGMKFDDQRQGARPEYVLQACEDSLRRLRTDHIDLYQLHQPDPHTPIADTLTALDRLVREGKVREIGCSNFSAEQLREARTAAGSGARFASVQNRYNLFERDQQDVLTECRNQGMAFLPYFPLANGLLTGKYRQGKPLPPGSRAEAGFGPKVFTEENLARAERLIRFAESRGHSLLELAFSWLAAQPAVASVIAGAKSEEQVRQNAAAAHWRLGPADLKEVDSLLQG